MRYIYAAIFAVLLAAAGCTTTSTSPAKDVSLLTPKDIVTLYFESWNKKDYATMHSLISDGFKKLEPTAIDLDSFSAEMSKFYDTGTGMKVTSVNEALNDGETATVGYTVELQLKTGKREFSSSYTLRKRSNGWKMIHPYGQNIDTS